MTVAIQTLSFDADGTLWDFEATMRQSLAKTIDFLAGRDERGWGRFGSTASASRFRIPRISPRRKSVRFGNFLRCWTIGREALTR